jgi:hypothetical protein
VCGALLRTASPGDRWSGFEPSDQNGKNAEKTEPLSPASLPVVSPKMLLHPSGRMGLAILS